MTLAVKSHSIVETGRRHFRYVGFVPKSGMEPEYRLAWKHRDRYARLCNETPWWQFRKRHRRQQKYVEAVARSYRYGADLIVVTDYDGNKIEEYVDEQSNSRY